MTAFIGPPIMLFHLMLSADVSRPRRVIIPKPLDYSEIVERLQQAPLADEDEEDADNLDEDEDEIKCVSHR